ncbi:MAG: toll/interleukin-1 receptor domain-containing protein [Desulfobacterales bacterium]|nr:MAG: toll/interleukin-1 receptor domain-containing protein [Desulfobacterales bacterium]
MLPGAFISYSSPDRDFAQRLVRDLKERAISVWFDEAELEPGDSIIGKIEAGIDRMDYLIVILSPASVASRWVQEEVRMALHKGLAGRKFNVIPVLKTDCEIPLFLRDRKYVDLRPEADYPAGLEKIVGKLTRGRGSESQPSSVQLEFARIRNDEQYAVLRPLLDLLEPLVSRAARQRDKEIDNELRNILKQLQAEPRSGVGGRTHVEKMLGGFIQDDWRVNGDVHQANRDLVINKIKKLKVVIEAHRRNLGDLEVREAFAPEAVDLKALDAAEQRCRESIRNRFSEDARYYIPLAGETTEPVKGKAATHVPHSVRRRQQRIAAEFRELVEEVREIRRVRLDSLREAVDK